MSKLVEYVDLFASKTFSPKQGEIFDWYHEHSRRKHLDEQFEHILAMVWGRRCGKSDGGSALFAEMLVDTLCDVAEDIACGRRLPWSGIGRSRVRQRRSRPHELCFVIAPSGRDLIDISGHLLDIFSGPAEVFLHDDPKMAITDQGGRMWLVHEGAAVAVSFIPAKQASSMVGRGPAICYITESGFVPSMHWDRLVPSFWDRSTWVIAEGTPTQDASHWFTQLAVSGLPDDHDEADRSIARRDKRVHTSRANTIEHAFLRNAREAARLELEYKGKAYADRWIYAKWEKPSNVVFDEYDPHVSISDYVVYPPTLNGIKLPRPSRIEIDIDWHQGGRPGAATCTLIWKRRNPLDEHDPRPLFIVVDEFQDDDERLPYSKEGWWGIIKDMRDRWQPNAIYGDPTGTELIKRARRHGIKVKPSENADKSGRLQILNAQCHVSPQGNAAFYLTGECQKVAKVMQTLPWREDKDGNPTDKPSGYNDHLADCLAYCAGRHARSSSLMRRGWG
jgi:hypothetical protein